MELTKLFDPLAMAAAGGFSLAMLQYLKDGLPEKSLKWVNLFLSMAGAFLLFYKPGIPPNFDEIVKMVVTGIGAAGGADTTFGFLSGKKSAAFTLPSKTTIPKPPEDMIAPELKAAIKAMIDSLQKQPAEVKK